MMEKIKFLGLTALKNELNINFTGIHHFRLQSDTFHDLDLMLLFSHSQCLLGIKELNTADI